MKFNYEMYDKLYPRQEPKVDDIPAEDKMVEDVKVEEKKEVTKPEAEPMEEDNNGVPGSDEPVTE